MRRPTVPGPASWMPAKLPAAIPPFRLPEELPRAVTPFSDWPALGFPPVIALVLGTPGSPPCPPRRNAATTALAQARFNMTSLPFLISITS
ncbi:MAG: hypothetical protein VX588_00170 [Verrucomicrobiota bacterium]|nr:hypothetical protein [Verrucomicrobiota bacterium]